MNADNSLTGTATLFLALGDKTRLRLLNLMRDREVCVSSFTDILGDSQPKISRHLAYLRSAGVVDVRRDGKWMHYSISAHMDESRRMLIFELFKWMEGQHALLRDREKYAAAFGGSPPGLVTEAGAEFIPSEQEVRVVRERRPRNTARRIQAPEPEPSDQPEVHHNELEDFLL